MHLCVLLQTTKKDRSTHVQNVRIINKLTGEQLFQGHEPISQ